MTHYVIRSGLTRRLVEADNARAARIIFLQHVPRANLLAVPYEKCVVTEATEADIAEFRPNYTTKVWRPIKGQGELVLDDVRREKKTKRKGSGYA